MACRSNPGPMDLGQQEKAVGARLLDLVAELDTISRSFAEIHDVSANEFRAMLFIAVAEERGQQFTAGELRRRMNMSGAAICYIVERLVRRGHVRRDVDPFDRRRVILRFVHGGRDVVDEFMSRLDHYAYRALGDMADAELEVAERVIAQLVAAILEFHTELPSSTKH